MENPRDRAGRLCGAPKWRILVQGEVPANGIVIFGVAAQHTAQIGLAESPFHNLDWRAGNTALPLLFRQIPTPHALCPVRVDAVEEVSDERAGLLIGAVIECGCTRRFVAFEAEAEPEGLRITPWPLRGRWGSPYVDLDFKPRSRPEVRQEH